MKQTLERKEVNPRILRWSLILLNYDYTLEHRSSDRMRHADALSRQNSVFIISENSLELNLSILQGVDKVIQELKIKLQKQNDKFFELSNGLVYRKQKNKLLFYVPGSMENSIIRSSHAHEAIGHQAVNKTIEYLLRTYWFPEARKKVSSFIKNCLKCITFTGNKNKVEGKLHVIDKGDIPFQCIHIDNYGPLERTRHNKKYIFEIIDAFNKFVKFYVTKSTDTDEVINHLKSYFTNYSKLLRIISDRGSAFTSKKFEEFMNQEDIRHVLIATATPHSNGQIERINRSTQILAKLWDSPKDWDRVITGVEFAINNSINRATGETPSRLLFGINQIGSIDDKLRMELESQGTIERDLVKIRECAVEKIEFANIFITKSITTKSIRLQQSIMWANM